MNSFSHSFVDPTPIELVSHPVGQG